MKISWKWNSRRTRRLAGWSVLVLAWLGVLLGAALPAWRDARAKHGEIQDLQSRLAEMDRWTVAGMWLEQSLETRSGDINRRWDELFPAERFREELFLELAAVADRSGVSDFRLQEVRESKMDEDHLWLERPDGDLGEWMSGEVPGVALGFYRIKASFTGDYGRAAEFLGGLKRIARALSVRSLDVHPGDEGVKVELKLDVYVRESTQS